MAILTHRILTLKCRIENGSQIGRDSGHSLTLVHCASSATVFIGVMKRLKTCIILCLYDHPGSPDNSRSDFSTKENAECADCVRGEHANDGEGHREFPVQSVSQNCPGEDKKNVSILETPNVKHKQQLNNIKLEMHVLYLCHGEGYTSQSLDSIGEH